MILNKFRQVPRYQSFAGWKTFPLMFLICSLFCCKKTINMDANKSYVNVIHTAYNVDSISISIGGVPLYATPLVFGQSSGTATNPYDTTTAGVQELIVFQGTHPPLISGNAAFQQQSYYSLFVYDTLNQSSIKVILFQNSVGSRTDTFTYIRYLNFVPSSLIGIKVVYPRDTTGFIKANAGDSVNVGFGPYYYAYFVGDNPNPATYGFATVHIGINNIYAFIDSANPRIDTVNPINDSANFKYLGQLQFDSTINYNVYLQGFLDSLQGENLLKNIQLKSFPIN